MESFQHHFLIFLSVSQKFYLKRQMTASLFRKTNPLGCMCAIFTYDSWPKSQNTLVPPFLFL